MIKNESHILRKKIEKNKFIFGEKKISKFFIIE